jgi:hypothetical protein
MMLLGQVSTHGEVVIGIEAVEESFSGWLSGTVLETVAVLETKSPAEAPESNK